MADLVELTADLVAHLRGLGLAPTPDVATLFCRAVDTLGLHDLEDLYWTGRTVLVHDVSAVSAYDRAFLAWVLGGAPEETVQLSVLIGPADGADSASKPGSQEPAENTQLTDADAPARADAERAAEVDPVGRRVSSAERLRRRRFGAATPQELYALQELMRSLTLELPRRRVRRLRRLRHGRHVDLRRSLQTAVATDGEVLKLARRSRTSRPRDLVLLLDVSGSMASYARALLQFAFTAQVAAARVEAFCFATRLTRITHDLQQRTVDAALEHAADRIVDWEGGTRIGASLAELNRVHAPRGRLRGAVVVICSDGLERGDPDQLGQEMERLARLAYRVLWVNPLKGEEGYEPLARGMAAALPHVHRFLPGHDLRSLEELASVVGALR